MAIVDIYCLWANPTYTHWVVPGHETYVNPETPHCDVGVFIDHTALRQELRGQYRIKFMVLHEPRIKQAALYKMVEDEANDFDHIFSYDERILALLPHAYLMPALGSWLTEQSIPKKTERVAMICSSKVTPDHQYDGYRMRARAAAELVSRGITVHGRGRVPVPGPGRYGNKSTVIGPAEFAVEAECHKANHWFTEKLNDCLVMKTVPIYYGPDDIADYFDTGGFLLWNNMAELRQILDRVLTGEVSYAQLQPHIERNYTLGFKWAYTGRRRAAKIAELLERE